MLSQKLSDNIKYGFFFFNQYQLRQFLANVNKKSAKITQLSTF